MQKIKRLLGLLIFLFTLPLVIGQLPFPNNQNLVEEKKPEQKLMAYAASPLTQPLEQQISDPFHVLLLFTHSHESYHPIVAQKSGKKAVDYDEQTNIFSMQEMIRHHLQLNNLQSSVLEVDVMNEMKKQGATLNQAYKFVRPYLKQELTDSNYDLVLDFHRDSARAKTTTLKIGEEKYAKIAFVIGAEHNAFEWNLGYAEKLHASLNQIVPGISRGILKKQGEGVNGIYNQDLSKVLLVVELGGVDNTEDELNRTLAVLAQAIAKTFVSEQL